MDQSPRGSASRGAERGTRGPASDEPGMGGAHKDMDDFEVTRAVETPSAARPASARSASSTSAPATIAPGVRIGPYRIERLIAQGGNARVYRAVDETLARPVALKILDDTGGHESRERFLREVQLVAGLVHPHVVGLYAAGEQDGVTFAAMELLPGSLADELARR